MQWMERRATTLQVAKNWILSYLGNFAGALLLVKMVSMTGLLVAAPAPLKFAAIKTSLSFTEVGLSTIENLHQPVLSGGSKSHRVFKKHALHINAND